MYLCSKIIVKQGDMEEKISLTVKDWADADKPRERLILQGKKQLSDAELIAILLRSGVPGKNVLDVAREILALAGNSLTELSRIDNRQLSSIRGIGSAKAATLMAALELGWRMQSELDAASKTVLADSNDLFKYILHLIADLDHEEFWAVYLNAQHTVLGRQRISVGGQTSTPVDIRIVMRGALENKATHFAVAHNHPSGSLKPSSDDKRLTQNLDQAGKMLDIKLTDHIIVAISLDGQANYYSFRDNGLIL